jgi:hypothetical protein
LAAHFAGYRMLNVGLSAGEVTASSRAGDQF